ncbi:uncharacterized protein TNCV_3754871 [Trichonephila clavipes]|nr:uncharacterized protein TNCV_3754871 [Trichonephila clavipes]
MKQFIEDLLNDPDTSEFGKYFQQNYAQRPEKSAYCYRKSLGINTNMYLESRHKKIKYHYFDGKHVKRLDVAIDRLLKLGAEHCLDPLLVAHNRRKPPIFPLVPEYEATPPNPSQPSAQRNELQFQIRGRVMGPHHSPLFEVVSRCVFDAPRTRFGAVKPFLPALFPSRPRDVPPVSSSLAALFFQTPPAGGVNSDIGLSFSTFLRDSGNDWTHPAPGQGGTAILIKNFISHYHVPTPPSFTGVEATLIPIAPIDYDPILIGSIYIPPINNYFRNLGAALNIIFNFNSKTILVGDFDATHTSWGCHCSDTRENRLYNYIVNNSIDVLAPPTPTRFGINSASIIDYALIKNLNWPLHDKFYTRAKLGPHKIRLNFTSQEPQNLNSPSTKYNFEQIYK